MPLTVLASTVVAAVFVRARRPDTPRLAADAPALAQSSPVATSLPPFRARDVPADASVSPGGPSMLHGDARHTSRARARAPVHPELAWSFHADGPVESQVVTSPDGATLYVTTLGGTLWALTTTGQARFRVALGARSYGTPAVAPDGTVYVGVDGGALYAVDPAGHVVFRFETPGDADTCPVLTDEGVVVFAAGSRVYGVSRRGDVVFRFQARGKVYTSPALLPVAAGRRARIVFGSQDDHVYALDARGELVWDTPLGADVDGAPAVSDDGVIHVGTDGDEVVALGDDGRVIWRTNVGGYVRGALSLGRNGDVLAGVMGPTPGVVALAAGGRLALRHDVRGNGKREVGVLGGPVEDDEGSLVFAGQDGVVRALAPAGAERWRYAAGVEIDAPVTLLPTGVVVVGTYGGDVLALADAVAK